MHHDYQCALATDEIDKKLEEGIYGESLRHIVSLRLSL